MGKYYTTTSDELYHWKYIDRVKTSSGKWKYIYDQTELNRFDKGEERISRGARKVGPNTIETYEGKTIYKKTNNLLGSTKTSGQYVLNGGFSNKNTATPQKHYTEVKVKEQGKLDRAQAKVEKWVYNSFLKDGSSLSSFKKKNSARISKGKKATSNLIKRLSSKK